MALRVGVAVVTAFLLAILFWKFVRLRNSREADARGRRVEVMGHIILASVLLTAVVVGRENARTPISLAMLIAAVAGLFLIRKGERL